MKCEETSILIEALLDGELPENEADTVQEHIKDCPACTRDLNDLTALRERLHQISRSSVPTTLHEKISGEIAATIGKEAPSGFWKWPQVMMTHATAAVVGGVIVYGSLFLLPVAQTLEEEVLSAHVLSLTDGKLMQLKAGDTHKVKPWFSGKLNYAPIVANLTEKGFPLLGARLDILGGGKVAALVYGRRAHKINLFVFPNKKAVKHQRMVFTRDGFNILKWHKQKFEFWAISDLSVDELIAFSRAISAKTEMQ